MISCQYCLHFKRSIVVDNESGTRLCYMSLKKVKALSQYCKFFRITNIIYCFANNQRYYYVVCLERQKQNICCCSQGELIRTMHQITATKSRIKHTKQPIYLKSEEKL